MKYTFRLLAQEIISRETRKGIDMNITHATSIVRHILDIASEDVIGFQVFLLKQVEKRHKKGGK